MTVSGKIKYQMDEWIRGFLIELLVFSLFSSENILDPDFV